MYEEKFNQWIAERGISSAHLVEIARIAFEYGASCQRDSVIQVVQTAYAESLERQVVELRHEVAELRYEATIDPVKLAALGWQLVKCEVCGGYAHAFPLPRNTSK